MLTGIRGRRVVVSQFPAIAGRIPDARIEMEEETTADGAEGVRDLEPSLTLPDRTIFSCQLFFTSSFLHCE